MRTMRHFWMFVLVPIAVVLGPALPMWLLVLLAVMGLCSLLWRWSLWMVLGLALLLPAAAPAAPPTTTVTVYWTWSPNPAHLGGLSTNDYLTNVVFTLYASTNVTVPVTNWPVAASWPASSLTNQPVGSSWSNRVPVDIDVKFFVLTAGVTNGASPFSNVAVWLPAPPAGTVAIGK